MRDCFGVWYKRLVTLRQFFHIADNDRREPHIVTAGRSRGAHGLPGAEALAIFFGIRAVGRGGRVGDGGRGPVSFFCRRVFCFFQVERARERSISD